MKTTHTQTHAWNNTFISTQSVSHQHCGGEIWCGNNSAAEAYGKFIRSEWVVFVWFDQCFTYTNAHTESVSVCELINVMDVKLWPFLVEPPAAARKMSVHVCVRTVSPSAGCTSSWRSPAARPRWRRRSSRLVCKLSSASSRGAAPPRTSDWPGRGNGGGCAWPHPRAWQADLRLHFQLWRTPCPPGERKKTD